MASHPNEGDEAGLVAAAPARIRMRVVGGDDDHCHDTTIHDERRSPDASGGPRSSLWRPLEPGGSPSGALRRS
eukprot:7653598-Pyramimonas_sp.AAC.1